MLFPCDALPTSLWCRQGKVTEAMLDTPKALFVLIKPHLRYVRLPAAAMSPHACRQGKVTDAMLDTPRLLFVLTGMCEAAAQLLMMTGAALLVVLHLAGRAR
jgi:hypothetical protein